MKLLEYLHFQLALEGIILDGVSGLFHLQSGSDGRPLVIEVQLANGETISYYHVSTAGEIHKGLQALAREFLFPDIRSIVGLLRSHGLQVFPEHYKTYMFPDMSSLEQDATVIRLPCDDSRVKAFGFDGFGNDVFAMDEGGVILSACVSARENDACAEAWVLTAPERRKKGLAQAVVSAWAVSVQAAGKIAFYSHRLENIASAGLAKRLNLQLVYEEISIEQAG